MSSGLRELLPGMAASIASGMTITSLPNGGGTTVTLADVRILGSTDATYGAIGWLPELTGQPFVVIEAEGVSDTQPEPNRAWALYRVKLFVAVEHADTPAVAENYNDLALAWSDSARQFIAANRLIRPASNTLYPIAGDVQWLFTGATIQYKHAVYGVEFYGVEVTSTVRITISVSYQQ